MGFQTSERGNRPTVWHIGPRVRRVRAPENVRIRRSVGVENARKPKGAVERLIRETVRAQGMGKDLRTSRSFKNNYLFKNES